VAVLGARSPADDIARLERQRVEARRSGHEIGRFYSRSYRGITALGQYEAIEQVQRLTPDATYARYHEVTVEIHGNTAIVTGAEGAPDTPVTGVTGERDRVLRIWTRERGAWTIVAAQSTWVGPRTDAAPAAGALPDTPPPAYAPGNTTEEGLWRSQEALMRSFADADAASYTRFSTERSLRLTTNGDAIAREQWLGTIARRAKGPLAIVDEVRIAAYGDVGVVTLRGHEASPTRQSWVYLKQDGVWKLHLRYTTLIRRSNG
jgi:hypothetical protein